MQVWKITNLKPRSKQFDLLSRRSNKIEPSLFIRSMMDSSLLTERKYICNPKLDEINTVYLK